MNPALWTDEALSGAVDRALSELKLEPVETVKSTEFDAKTRDRLHEIAAELDSPNFASRDAKRLAAANFKRVNRGSGR